MGGRTGYAQNPFARLGSGRFIAAILLVVLTLVSGCAAVVPLEQAGSLSSYQRLEATNGLLTRAQVSVSKDEVLVAKTVRIVPTSFRATEDGPKLSDAQKKLVANVVDRSLCIGLSDRYQIVLSAQPADLSVHAVITRIVGTDETAAGVSSAASIATRVATAVASVSVPLPSLRIPIGLGGLALEGGGARSLWPAESGHGVGARRRYLDHSAEGLHRRRRLRSGRVVRQ
jgi:hypothetical protein